VKRGSNYTGYACGTYIKVEDRSEVLSSQDTYPILLLLVSLSLSSSLFTISISFFFLNVRNSTSGDIIDGLSCYKEVTIEEELPGTDNCKLLS